MYIYIYTYIFRQLWLPGYAWMDTITLWMISFPYFIRGVWDGYLLHTLFANFSAGDTQMAYGHALHFGG